MTISRRDQLPFILYGLTGFTGLLSEQSFERYVSLLVGATVSASAVVLFSYFLGFAIGGAAAAELLRRGRIRKPWRLYGTLELGIGVTCIGLTYWFHPLSAMLAPLLASVESGFSLHAIRFAIGCMYILPAAILMGASFPLLAQVVDSQGDSGGRRWTQVYAVNLAGAVAATLFAPYLLIPMIGVRGVLWLCFAICLFVFLLTRRGESVSEAAGVAPVEMIRAKLDGDAWLLLAAAFASGAIFFALEVLWTHLIGVALGTSVYAFSSMLLMVLTGLLLGARRVEKAIAANKPIVYSKLFFLAGLALMVQFRFWDYGQGIFVWSPPEFLQSFYFAQGVKLLLTAFLIIPSAVLVGSIYPSLLASPVLKQRGRSYLVGHLNAWNSVGCLAGALIALFVLIPGAGSEMSLKGIASLLLVLGVLFVLRETPRRKELINALSFVGLVCIYLVWWSWDTRLLTSGMNVYFGRDHAPASISELAPPVSTVVEAAQDRGEPPEKRITFFHEDAQGGITTVVESGVPIPGGWRTERTLYTNGKFQGNDDVEGEVVAQTGFSVLPALFTDRRENALLIGLGTGNSAAVLLYPGYRRVVVAEIAAGIVEAASSVFNDLNRDVLKDPRVHLALEDGRNVLLTHTGDPFDLVTIELNSIWFAGATNLYSREFYQTVSENLHQEGVLQQWVQLHHISIRELSCALATVRAVFPHVSFWQVGGQGMIIATKGPQVITEQRMHDIAQKLAAADATLPTSPEEFVADVARSQIASPGDVDRLIEEQRPVINTDHNRWIEYATPRYNASSEDWRRKNLEYFASLRSR